jgi:hypothetical protein
MAALPADYGLWSKITTVPACLAGLARSDRAGRIGCFMGLAVSINGPFKLHFRQANSFKKPTRQLLPSVCFMVKTALHPAPLKPSLYICPSAELQFYKPLNIKGLRL